MNCTDDKVISSDQESIKPKYNLELLWHIVRSFAGSGVEKYAKEVWLALGRDPIKVDKKNKNKKVYAEALKNETELLYELINLLIIEDKKTEELKTNREENKLITKIQDQREIK